MTTLSQALRRITLSEQLPATPDRHGDVSPTLPAPIMPSVVVHGGLNNSDLYNPRTAVLVQVVVQLDWGVGDSLDLYWDNGVLDMDALGGADVAIRVDIDGNLDVPSDGLLTWTGQPVIGPAVLVQKPFSIRQAAPRITLYVPNDKAAALVGSTATVYYDGVKDGVSSRSRRVTVRLVGQPVILAAPRLTGVTGTTYNPDLIIGSHQEVVVPTYGFMAVGQSVTLVWEGITASGSSVYQTWTRPIEQASQIGLPISFQVEKAYATALVGGSLRVSYRVASLGQAYASEVLLLAVSGQVNTLPAPETDPHFPGGQVDPGQVGNTVAVVVRANPALLPGDSISVHWHGRPDASINLTASFPSTGDLSVQIARVPYITGNANGAVDVWYDARRNGVIVGSSRFLTLTIGEAGQQPWPAPIVNDATGGQANPLSPIRPGTSNTPNTATVVLTDSRLAEGDTVSVVWRYLDGTPAANFSASVGSDRTGLVSVPSSVIATSLDSTVEVVCAVFRNGQLIGTSPALRLQVLGMPQSALPTPAIIQAPGADLDVSNLNGDATATVAAWPLIALGQRYWLRAHGNLSDGSATTIELASDRPVTSLNAVTHVIPLARLQALRDGSDLTLEMRVAFDSPA